MSGSSGAMRLGLVGELARGARRRRSRPRPAPATPRDSRARRGGCADSARAASGERRMRADDRPQHHRQHGDRRDRDHQHHHRGLDAPALPGDGDLAGTVGEPDGGERQQADDDEIDDDADHRWISSLTCPSAASASAATAAGSPFDAGGARLRLLDPGLGRARARRPAAAPARRARRQDPPAPP